MKQTLINHIAIYYKLIDNAMKVIIETFQIKLSVLKIYVFEGNKKGTWVRINILLKTITILS